MQSGSGRHGQTRTTMKTNLLDGLFSISGRNGVGSSMMTEQMLSDLHEIAFQLARIADMMEGLRESTNPLDQWAEPDDESVVRAFYTDERQEIIDDQLQKMGKFKK